MQLTRRELTHVRFEPEVDGGTTYAFSYRASRLSIGRKNMHRLIVRAGEEGCELDHLVEELVDGDAPVGEYYPDKGALLLDVVKLVGAQVLTIAEGRATAQPQP